MEAFPRSLSLLALGAFFWVSVACDGSSEGAHDPARSVNVRDSAGIEIVENRSPVWTDETRWTIAPEPEVTIRSETTDYNLIFSRVGDVVRLSDGRIVLESRLTRQLFVYGPSGALLDTWGGQGEGPQEFRYTDGLARCRGDTLLVRDATGLVFVDPTGYLGPRQGIRQELQTWDAVELRGLSHDCAAALLTIGQRELTPVNESTFSYPHLSVWASLIGEGIDTLGMFPHEALTIYDGQPARVPFHTVPSWTVGDTLVYFGVGDRAEIQILGEGGRAARLIRWKADPQPISESDWQAYGEERERFLAVNPRSAAFTPPPGVRPDPDQMPVYAGEGHASSYESGFHVDGEGNLWVRHYRRQSLFFFSSTHRPIRPPEHWWVFDPAGRWLGGVETPGNFLVKSISGGLLLGISWDELDVEEVRAYRIEKSGEGGGPRRGTFSRFTG